jgi:hypothetical protein
LAALIEEIGHLAEVSGAEMAIHRKNSSAAVRALSPSGGCFRSTALSRPWC